MRVELFTAGCRLCRDAQVQYTAKFAQLDIEIHKAEECSNGSCCQRAGQYGIAAVPTLVVDGVIVQVGLPSVSDLLRMERMITGEIQTA